MPHDHRVRVLVCFWGRRGGGPRYAHELVRSLDGQASAEVHVSLSRQSEFFARTEALGLPSCHIETYTGISGFIRSPIRMLAVARTLTRYLIEHSIDCVILAMWHPWWYAVHAAARRAQVPIVYVEHDGPAVTGRGPERRIGDRHRLKCAAHVVALSQYIADLLVELRGVPPTGLEVIPHGVFGPVIGMPQQPIRTHPGVGAPFRILFFGRLTKRKGLGLLSEAYADLRSSRDWLELYVIGAGPVGISSGLMGLAGVKLVNHYVSDEEASKAFTQCHVVVMPYLDASQSGVAAIAYGAGLPMVATPVGGLPEQVLHGLTGEVSTDMTSVGLARALARLIDDPSHYDQVAQGVVSAATERFGWERIASQFAVTLTRVHKQGSRFSGREP